MELLAQWRPVVDWSGLYEVSDTGDVRSVERVKIDSIGRRRPVGGVILRQFIGKGGDYLCVTLSDRPHRMTSVRVHLLVARAFLGERPTDAHEVAHRDDDHASNAAIDLRWATRAENVAERAARGRYKPARQRDGRCMRGHPLASPNLLGDRARRGLLVCRSCKLAGDRLRSWPSGVARPMRSTLADTLYADLIAA